MRLRVLSVISSVQSPMGTYLTTVRISRVIRAGSGSITLPDRSVLRFRSGSERPGSVIVITSNNPIVPPFVVDLRFD